MASTAPIHFTGVRRRGRYPKTAVFAAGVALDHHASTSSTSVGSSSPLPFLLTRQDTSHMRRRYAKAIFGSWP
jgi:hypothetical protein